MAIAYDIAGSMAGCKRKTFALSENGYPEEIVQLYKDARENVTRMIQDQRTELILRIKEKAKELGYSLPSCDESLMKCLDQRIRLEAKNHNNEEFLALLKEGIVKPVGVGLGLFSLLILYHVLKVHRAKRLKRQEQLDVAVAATEKENQEGDGQTDQTVNPKFPRSILFHMRRPLSSDLCELKITKHEQNKMNSDGLLPIKELRYYAVWRRGALLSFVPLSIIDLVFACAFLNEEINKPDGDLFKRNAIGWVIYAMQNVLPEVAAVAGTIAALMTWTDFKKSGKAFHYAIYLGLALELLPTFLTADWTYNYTGDIDQDTSLYIGRAKGAISSISRWVSFMLSFPTGFNRGAMNVMGLIPGCFVPGLLLVVMTPFSMVIFLSLMNSLAQLFGYWAFTIFIITLILNQLKYVIMRTDYLAGNVQKIRNATMAKILQFVAHSGFICLVIWLVNLPTVKVTAAYVSEKPFFIDPFKLVGVVGVANLSFSAMAMQKIFSFLKQMYFYRLLFTDLVLSAVLIGEGEHKCKQLKDFLMPKRDSGSSDAETPSASGDGGGVNGAFFPVTTLPKEKSEYIDISGTYDVDDDDDEDEGYMWSTDKSFTMAKTLDHVPEP